ncbi:MAG: 1-acyl-sn-glycerol-3-phosphate acyltransferase [Bacteroidales bacterium]
MHSTKKNFIDIEQVVKKKAPGAARKIPSFIFSALKKIICQDELNEFLHKNEGKVGLDFADALVGQLSSGVEVVGLENIPLDGRYIFASNHPLGGMDGVTLLSVLGKRFGPQVRFIVNDLLMNVKPLTPVFVPVNKHGGQSKSNLDSLNSVLESDAQVAIFPAGLVSRLQDNGKIEDLDWKKTFVSQAVRYQRDIVPVYFEAKNSNFFYKFAFWRKKLKVKVNIDMLFLPRELFNKKNQKFIVHFGQPIPYESLQEERSHQEWAKHIKNQLYAKNYRTHR